MLSVAVGDIRVVVGKRLKKVEKRLDGAMVGSRGAVATPGGILHAPSSISTFSPSTTPHQPLDIFLNPRLVRLKPFHSNFRNFQGSSLSELDTVARCLDSSAGRFGGDDNPLSHVSLATDAGRRTPRCVYRVRSCQNGRPEEARCGE